ncbi:hypothetical protein D7X55_11225 [Corallococcus sp. AB049A]|nr:hypothetical protein D7X55_11225 [Corallococcus sp. AB049A]
MLTASLILGGCHSSSGDDAGTQPPPPVDSGTPDAGEVWDGGAETLVDPGDVVEQAPYSDCTFTPEAGSTLASCSDPALFDRSDTPPLRTGSEFFSGAIGIRVPGDGFIYVVDANRGLLILQEE